MSKNETEVDIRTLNPQTYRRDPAKGPSPLAELTIHVEAKVYSKRTNKLNMGWVRGLDAVQQFLMMK
jgi:hypothetical protein